MVQTSNRAQQQLERINQALSDGTLHDVDELIQDINSADIAHLIESTPPNERTIIWGLTTPDKRNEILQYLNEEVRADFLSNMDIEQLVTLTQELETDDSADLLQSLPKPVADQILRALSEHDRQRVEPVLSYDEDTAGGLMNTDTVTVRMDNKLATVLRYLRSHDTLPSSTDSLLVVNRQGLYLGNLPLTKLLVSDPELTVQETMIDDQEAILADTPAHDVAAIFERHDLVSAAVINQEGKLLGRITIDDVVDVIRETADHNLMGGVGLDEEEDAFAPVLKTARRRAVWLGINLITALLASAVIGLFDETLKTAVALAILMPVVANMGGIAGTQTLTLIIRGMALGQIGRPNIRWFLRRETGAALLNGCCWAIVVGTAAAAWFNSTLIGYLIAVAMLFNLIIAGLAGVIIPFALKRVNIDPALAGGVVLTTVTDIMGFVIFLGLASIFV